MLYATRVEDRFGNWVTYSYTNAYGEAGRLSEINASDGRKITVAYAGGAISSVTAAASDSASRTWNYTTTLTPAGRRTLTSVTLPDTSQWQIGFAQFTDAEIKYLKTYPVGEPVRSCIDLEYPQNATFTPVGTLVHPSGAVGEFTAAIIEHGRTNVPLGCSNVWAVPGNGGLDNDPNDDVNLYPISFHQFSLIKRRVWGVGVPLAQWLYEYFPTQSIFMHPGTTWAVPICMVGAACHQPPVCNNGSCPGSSLTVVTSPTGQWTRYTYGNSFKYNEGKLLRVEQGTGPDNILRVVQHDYEFARSGRSYPLRFGISLKFNGGYTDFVRPQTQTLTTEQGVTFKWEVSPCGATPEPCFDNYLRPKRVTRSSTLTANPTRTEETTFIDNLNRWVVGQVGQVRCLASSPSSSACNGGSTSTMSETTYDPRWAVPLVSKEFGRTTAALTWDTASSVASGQRGTVRTVADGNGNVTTATNWKRGIPRSLAFPATSEAPTGSVRTAAVNDHGWVTGVTDENGFLTSYSHDNMGRVTTITYPPGDSVPWANTTAAFSRSAAAKYGLPSGHWQHIVATGVGTKITYFDALWRPVVTETFDATNAALTTATRSVVVQRYDADARQIFQSYPMATLTNFAGTTLQGTHTTFDSLDRTIQVAQDWEGPGRLTTTTQYLTDLRTQVTNPRGHSTTTGYLAWDSASKELPITIAHPEGAFTDIPRDAFGKPVSLVRRNASGATSLARHYVYDTRQFLCKSVEPESGATLMAYDGAGNLVWSKSGSALASTTSCDTALVPAADRTVRSYDARNRLGSLSFPDGRGNQQWSYTVDGLAAIVSTNNSSGGDTVVNSYTYNRRRLPASESVNVDGQQWAIGYQYNILGHLQAMSLPGGTPVDFAPNALGSPTRAGVYATAASYFPNGLLKQFTYGNGLRRIVTQNSRGLPETICDVSGAACSASAVLHESSDYDQNGNVLGITDGRAGNRGNRDMVYDALDRLIQAVSPMFGVANYTYDVLDNLGSVRVTGGTASRNHAYLYDVNNRLTNITNTIGGATVIGLAYDVQGNVQNKNGLLHDFDFGNRLRSAGGEHYLYDAHGRRVRAVRNGQAIYSFYGQDGTLRFQRDERSGKSTDYVHLGSQLVAQAEIAIPLNAPMLTAPGSSQNGAYTVSWTASPIASNYQLQERLGGGSWSTVHDAAATSKAISGKASGTWSYQVRACSATTCGAWSTPASVSVQLPPVSAPALSTPAEGANGSFTVTWTTVAAADRYQLQERAGGGSWATIHDAAGNSKAISGKATGTWSYQARGCNAAGCGPWSVTGTTLVTHVPAQAPVLSVPSSNLTGAYTVGWAPVSTATRYEVDEQFAGGNWSQIHNAASTSVAVSGKITGTWGYRARACNSVGCSGWSSTANVAVTRPPTAVPVVTAPPTNTSGSYTVSWTGVTHAASYQVQERKDAGAWGTIHDGAGASRAVSGKTNGYWGYQVRACNAAGCGGWSGMAAVQVTSSPPTMPTLNLMHTGTTTFTASWAAVAMATHYQLQEQLNNGTWVMAWEGATTSLNFVKPYGIYRYQLRACNAAGCSAWTATQTIVLETPGGGPIEP